MKQYSAPTQNYSTVIKPEKNQPFFAPTFYGKSNLNRWDENASLGWFTPTDGKSFFLAITGIDTKMLKEILLFLSMKTRINVQDCQAQRLQDLMQSVDGFVENFPLNDQPLKPSETENSKNQLPSERPVFLQEVDEKIEENLCNECFKGSDLARLLCCCEMQLYRKIKQLAKLSPANYIRRYRLRRSLENLQESELPITQICFNVGFHSLEYFSRSFKKEFGICPSAFRSGQNVEIVQANV